jgi:hypothetical protein
MVAHFRFAETTLTLTLGRHQMEQLPCGCHIGTDVIDGTNAFLIVPCSLQCDNYLFVLAESERQHKPTTIIDAR